VIDSAAVELTAARFKALGEPTRLRILEVLADGPSCVCELRDRTGIGGPLMSHHLNVLRDSGLVTATRRGRWIDYELSESAVHELAASIPRGGGGRGS
jgi:ArsR family transcriptional regulator, arsenate/arsenite/antimonite-responsive transcriptional repressor